MIKSLEQHGTPIIFVLGILTGVAGMVLLQDGAGMQTQQNHNVIDGGKNMVRVQSVIDGDTITIVGGEKVRLIGIDTPERGEEYYGEASERLRELIDEQEIRLGKDVSERDRYGRLLRHVYIGDTWVNAEMIRGGYARLVTFPPDVMHVDEFERLEREAREKKRGLWGLEVQ